MYNIKTVNKISPIGMEQFDKAKYNVSDNIENADAILIRSTDIQSMQFDKSLKCIARAGAGVNNIPVERCSEEGIVVFNTPGANANAVKELVIAGLMLASRDVIGSIEWAKTLKGKGKEVPALVEAGKSAFTGPEILGKTLGVIGLGAVGAPVAAAALQLGMKVYGCDPYLSVDAAWRLDKSIIHAMSYEEIYQNSDYITIHTPATPETKGMINAEAISHMKDGVKILNFARADLVNSTDMLAALKSGKVSRYIVDFPTDEMLCVDGVIDIPHLGASSPESEDNCAYMAVAQTIDFLENGNIVNSVNFPNVTMERSGHDRIGVIHKNIPNMISQITAAFSGMGANIENMTNKSRGDYAYTLVDTVSLPKGIAEKIGGIDGVIRTTVF